MEGGIQMKKQVLIVSENLAVCQAFKERLQDDHTDVSYALSAIKAMDIFIKNLCCLAIIDIHPSNKDNTEIIRVMRNTKHIPILALTPTMKTEEKIALFHAGADVCLDKTTDMKVCVAQANALIKIFLESNLDQQKIDLIAFGTELIINPRYRQAIVDGEPLVLTRKEFNLLRCLASYPDQVFTCEQLYNCVWDAEPVLTVDEIVKSQIKRLRRKLASVGKDYIQNEWGVGYKFVLSNDKA